MRQLGSVQERWQRQLAEWAIPDELAARAGASPWRLDPRLFVPDLSAPLTPSHEAILELVADVPEASLLDVGSGAGAAFWPVAPHLRRVLAIDENPSMLEVLLEEARAHPELLVETRVGRLQELLPGLDPADVAVSFHVVYNVPELGDYLGQLLAHGRRGVVLELTLHHPHHATAAMFEALWGVPRPPGPSAAEVIEALWALGVRPRVRVHEGTRRRADPLVRLEGLRQRLCLRAEEVSRIEELLADPGELANPAVTIVVEHEAHAGA